MCFSSREEYLRGKLDVELQQSGILKDYIFESIDNTILQVESMFFGFYSGGLDEVKKKIEKMKEQLEVVKKKSSEQLEVRKIHLIVGMIYVYI